MGHAVSGLPCINTGAVTQGGGPCGDEQLPPG